MAREKALGERCFAPEFTRMDLAGAPLETVLACWQGWCIPARFDVFLTSGKVPQRVSEYRMFVTHARTGWSALPAIREAESRLRGCQVDSRCLRSACTVLSEQGLWQVRRVGGLSLVDLTEAGQKLLSSVGMPVVESEWRRLAQLHNGIQQPRHSALVCHFTQQARRLGYTTQVCPGVPWDGVPMFKPDVSLVAGDETVLVEVEGSHSGEQERRARKWRNQYDAQGYVAIFTSTPHQAQRLATEARAAGAERGVVGDLRSVRKGGLIWSLRWTSAQEKFVSVSADRSPNVQEMLHD